MDGLAQVLERASSLVYLALAFVAARVWWRRRDQPAFWLAATFVSLGSVVLLGLVLEALGQEEPSRPFLIFFVFVLAAFPWLLLRFAGAFGAIRSRANGVAIVTTIALTLLVAFIDLPGPDEPPTPESSVFTIVFLLHWVWLSVVVVRRFWRAGADQPTVVRARMRLLAIGSMGLTLTIVLLSAAGSSTEITATSITFQIFGILAGVGFLLAFVPPTILRASWRSHEEGELQRASVDLMGAHSSAEVTDLLLPHVAAIVGAGGTAIVATDGTLIGSYGDLDESDGHVMRAKMSVGELRAIASPYTPFFGQGEELVLTHLGLLADLALARTSLLDREQAARQQAEALAGELEESNDEMERFVYTVSHDLKNPLNIVDGYLQLFMSDHADSLSDEGRDWLNRVHSNTLFMRALVDDLLQLSRIGRVQEEAEWIELRDLADQIAVETQMTAPVTVEVGDLPDVFAPSARIRQLVTNLVSNAVKYGEREDLTIRIEGERTPSGVRIHIADNGVGIPDDQRQAVFEVFTRLDGPGTAEGTGIGLSVCKRIVETMDGEISVIASDVGADFAIDLPHERIRYPA